MDQSGVWVMDDDGWIQDASGDDVVRYAGCGSHAAEWPDPKAKRLAVMAPQLLAACKALIDATDRPKNGDDGGACERADAWIRLRGVIKDMG